MNFEERTAEFWSKAQELQLDCTQIALGLGLLEVWRRNDFPALCAISNEELIKLLGISKNTFITAKKRLIANGLVICQDGNGRRQPIYIFDVGFLSEVVEAKKPQPKVVEVPAVVKEKPKPKPVEPLSLFAPEKPKKVTRPKKEYEPPTLEEVKRLFREAGGTDEEAERFYYYYDSQDWYKANGKVRIRRVDSAINSWLQKQGERHGRDKGSTSKKTDRNDAVRDFVTDGLL